MWSHKLCQTKLDASLDMTLRESYRNYVSAELYYLNFSQLFSLLVQKVMRSLRLDMREYTQELCSRYRL